VARIFPRSPARVYVKSGSDATVSEITRTHEYTAATRIAPSGVDASAAQDVPSSIGKSFNDLRDGRKIDEKRSIIDGIG